MFAVVLLFVIAVVANFLSALAGGGTGLLQLPALIFMGLPFGIALATHKVATVALGIGATIKHAKAGSFSLKHSVLILAIGLPFVVFGSLVVLKIPAEIAEFSLGVLTISLGVYSICNPKLGQGTSIQALTLKRVAIGAIGIAVIGFLNGSLASGTGLFLTLWLIYWFGFDYQRAVAHTLVWVGLVWNFTGAATLGFVGEIHWPWLAPLVVGALIGGYLGAHVGIKSGNAVIKRSFEVITVLTGLSLLLKPLISAQ